MQRTSFAGMHCSLARGLELIGDWWSPLIVRDLCLGVRRFDEIAEDLGISRNLLTRRLALLQKNGIVVRSAYQQRPVRYDYHLTGAGRDLVPVLLALTAWGDRWAGPRQGAPILFDHRDCGHRFEPRVVCSECGGTITADAVQARPGPGGAAKAGTRVLAQRLGSPARNGAAGNGAPARRSSRKR